MSSTKKQVSTLAVASNINEVVNGLNKKVAPLLRKLEGFSIETKEDYDRAAGIIAQLKEYKAEADRQQRTITDPANLIIKNARAIFTPFVNLVAQTEIMVKKEMLAFVVKRETAAKKLEVAFEDGKIKKVSTVVTKTNELRDNSSKDAQVRKVWQLFIIDEKKIPREFLAPDESRIKEALKAGKKVAGCEYRQVNQIAI